MIIRLVFLALAASLTAVLLKDNFRSGAMMVSIAGCVCLFYICTNIFLEIKSALGVFAMADTVDKDSMSLIVKTLAVAYITSFGTDICNDAGEKAIANALDTAGKMIMLSMAFPMLAGIFKTVSGIIK
jgi:stage III sporulation protein AD